MRLSQLLLVTLREDPADAELPSHKLLVRAGYIRRVGNGIYAYLPFMWRVLQKVSQIVREEMNRSGAQECLLPQLQPADLWRESGRWETYTKAEGIMFALRDRQDRDLGLGPTHEEVITALARDLIRSYRQLPLHLYQIQTKFRDEIRPRFGLMRGREFIMKDGYSFHADAASLDQTYNLMYQTYSRILQRCGLEFRAVEADSGAIGGSKSHEFMVLAEAGEDEVLFSEDGQYAANSEKAVSVPPKAQPSPFTAVETVETPDCSTLEALCESLNCSATQVLKTVLYGASFENDRQVLVLVGLRGDQTVNEVKLVNALTARAPRYDATALISLSPLESEAAQALLKPDCPLGYIAPDLSDKWINNQPHLEPAFLRLLDETAVPLQGFVAGANQLGQHRVGLRWGNPMVQPQEVVDVRQAQAGDRAVHDPSQRLRTARGIEIGHIFQLGRKYSQAMGATYTSEQGKEEALVMGCYGVGVSRLAQAAVEQSYDDQGIIWPVALAPYQAIVVIPNLKDAQQVAVADQIYHDLNQAGIETLLDDRQERAGVKFKDADLLGIPYRVVTGRAVAQGEVEVVIRASGESVQIAIDQILPTLRQWIARALAGPDR
ncbi:proline--tRNA ligase [Lyngbya confervoides]|uniref:Proline--tRNA ligase n=1 Tax=Lyngbya confervoides BDU141951 TaxID=1574623 RepID=A0ABD4T733_9CYAN|nr:proline--tRNA ligase [Lyngbya confervoides]MCM1984576.1 proline--tRNA ligase [Lyngbya confervoides BDU141951]